MMGFSKSHKTARKPTMFDYAGFEFWLLENGRKPRTIRKHRATLQRLDREVSPFTPENLKAYIVKKTNEGCVATYLNDMLIEAKVYARWAGIDGFEDIKMLKERPPVKATMSDEEIDQFLELPKSYKKASTKYYGIWTLFFSILAYTGMRPGECAKLTTGDVDFGRMIFVLRDTKTNDNRYVPIPPHLVESLTSHMSELSGDKLFPSRRGGNRDGFTPQVDDVDWHYNFHSRIKRMGIVRKGLTPYSLRHSFITRLLEEDVNLFKVQKIVGHSRIETTAGYTHLTTKDLQNTIKLDRLSMAKSSPQEKIKHLKKYILAAVQNMDDVMVEYKDTETGVEIVLKPKQDAKNA